MTLPVAKVVDAAEAPGGPPAASPPGPQDSASRPTRPARRAAWNPRGRLGGWGDGRWARLLLLEILPRVLGVVLAVAGVRYGVALREHVWETSAPVRFRYDIQNALNQGGRVLDGTGIPPVKGTRLPLRSVLSAWVDRYDRVYDEGQSRQGSGQRRRRWLFGGGGDGGGAPTGVPNQINYSLDYTPLRLLVMTLWTREVWAERGKTWNYSDEFTGPLMTLNTAVGLATAAGMFALVRHWARRGRRSEGRLPLAHAYRAWRSAPRDAWRRHGPWAVALAAAGLAWFNAAAIVNAHAFPQWDIWVMPFFLFACYAASAGRWGTAGALLVLGAMFKGQVLMVAPVLLAWPILRGKPGGALRLAVGGAAAVAAVAWPWLVRDPVAWPWILASVGALAVAGLVRALLLPKRKLAVPDPAAPPGVEPPDVRTARAATSVLPSRPPEQPRAKWQLRGRWWRWTTIALAFLAAAAVVCYPVIRTPTDPAAPADRWPALAALLALSALATACLLVRSWRALPYVVVGAVAAGVLFAGWQFDGSWSWYAIGFEFPTNHYLNLAMGPTSNLPAILANRYRWGLFDPVFTPPVGTQWLLGADPWPLRLALRAIYFLLIAPAALMLARHDRRNDPRALLCLTAPWILMFALMPQMHERYLIWAALMSAAGLAVGLSWGLAHLVVTFFALACVGYQVLSQNPGWWPAAHRLLGGTIPDTGWAVLLLGLVYLAGALGRTPVRRPSRMLNPSSPPSTP